MGGVGKVGAKRWCSVGTCSSGRLEAGLAGQRPIQPSEGGFSWPRADLAGRGRIEPAEAGWGPAGGPAEGRPRAGGGTLTKRIETDFGRKP